MVKIAGDSFIMGNDPRYPEEGPARRVAVKTFWIDTHELTNAEFARFVTATGYRTVAERAPPLLPNTPHRDARRRDRRCSPRPTKTIRAGGAGRLARSGAIRPDPRESIAGRDQRTGGADRV